MRRALASSLLSLLLLTTLVWGGCVSCEQFFMWPSVKSCCSSNGRCKTKTKQQTSSGRECKQIAFEHQKSLDLHVDLPSVAVPVSEFVARIAPPFAHWSRLDVIAPSPPDLQALHATFLI